MTNRYYILKNRLLGKEVVIERMVEGKLRRFIESNFPTGQIKAPSDSSFSPIDDSDLAIIVNKYFEIKSEALKRRVHRSSDFLPFAFLSQGLKCGSPVCLLLKEYKGDDAKALIERIENNASKYTTQELSNLLKIKEPAVFWKEHTSVSDAFKEISDIRSHLRQWVEAKTIPVGTGFLVGKNHILTNNHVLPDTTNSRNFIVRFGYETDFYGQQLDFVDYQLDPDFFYTNSDPLDYTLAKITPFPEESDKSRQLAFPEAGNNFGWLKLMTEEDGAIAIPPIPTLKRIGVGRLVWQQIKDLNERAKAQIVGTFQFSSIIGASRRDKILRKKNSDFRKGISQQAANYLETQSLMGQAISLIQHPKGKRKEIVLNGNRVQAIYQDWLQYETDAEPGSSGSPLFNDQWKLVGLHHSALIDAKDEEVIGYLGTRISRVLEDLRQKSVTSQDSTVSMALKAFLHDYVDTITGGKIYISAGRKRAIEGLEEAAVFESTMLFKLGQKVVEKIKAVSQERSYTMSAYHLQSEDDETANSLASTISWLQQYKNEYQPGCVAVEILLDAEAVPDQISQQKYDPEQNLGKGEKRGAKVFYYRSREERKVHADLLLNEYLKSAHNIDSDFPNRGTLPNKSMPFCSEVSMPSLVLYAGYMTSERDREFFQDDQHLDKLAEGIAIGLIRWANALVPALS